MRIFILQLILTTAVLGTVNNSIAQAKIGANPNKIVAGAKLQVDGDNTTATPAKLIVTGSGNMGIGTAAPGTLLDVNGAITNRETAVAVSANAATIPANTSLVQLTGSATASIALTAPTPPNAGQRLIVYNNTSGGFAATLNGYSLPNGQVMEFTYSNSGWRANNGGAIAIAPNTYWGTTGNSSTVAASNFIGTTDNIDFITRTNNIERMRVTGSGNVGIGTNLPNTKLEVSSGSSSVSGLRFTNMNNATTSTTNTAALGVDASGNVVVNALTSKYKTFLIDANTATNSEILIGNMGFQYAGTTCTNGNSYLQYRSISGTQYGVFHNAYSTNQAGAGALIANFPVASITTTYTNLTVLPVNCVNDGALSFVYFSVTDKLFYNVTMYISDGNGSASAQGYILVEIHK